MNSCVTASEAPALHTIDTAAAVLCKWFSQYDERGRDPTLHARTYDLKSAYRQAGLHSEGRSRGHIAVSWPERPSSCFFQSLVLPFGSTRVLHTFLRLSRAVWWLGAKLLALMWTNFYDVYIIF